MLSSSAHFPSQPILMFDINYAKGGKNKDTQALYALLAFYQELSFGKIYKRQDNGDFWFIDPDGTTATFITEDQYISLSKWDKEPLLLSGQQFKILSEIGGIPTPNYSYIPVHIEFPAEVTTINGQQIDLCLIHFSKSPPVETYFKGVLLLSDITAIRPSELALAHHLRLASTIPWESNHGLFPFMVQTNTGKTILYNGETQFASMGEIKGDDIASEVEFSWDKYQGVTQRVSRQDITLVIGKWDNQLEELYKQYQQKLLELNRLYTESWDARIATNRALPKARYSWWKKLFGF